MPNWKTHLEISKRINEKYKFEGMNYKKFLLGSILPDINNNYVVQGISKVFGHMQTHFCKDTWQGYLKFYEKYKTQIENKEPLFVGYVTHLYTDFTFNNNFYTSVRENNYPETDKEKLRIIKQSDFKTFNDKFDKNFVDIDEDAIEEFDVLLAETKRISEVDINLEDLKRVIHFLKESHLYENELQYYTEKELEELLEKVVREIIKSLT